MKKHQITHIAENFFSQFQFLHNKFEDKFLSLALGYKEQRVYILIMNFLVNLF